MNDHPRPRLIDGHLHLDPRYGSAMEAAAALDQGLSVSGVERAFVLHLLTQPWPVEAVGAALSAFPRLIGFVNIDPLADDAARRFRHSVEDLGFAGLKLHPRLQNFSLLDLRVQALVSQAGEMGVPVVIDAFPDGDWLMMGFNPLTFAHLVKTCPKTKVVVAHFGGHHCIDMMMLAKRLPNMWFDLSFSLLYYRGSSIPADLAYCCRSMRFQRVLFGTDFPDRPHENAIPASLRLLNELGIEGSDLDRILWRNAAELMGWLNF